MTASQVRNPSNARRGAGFALGFAALAGLLAPWPAAAQAGPNEASVSMHLLTDVGIGKGVGTITLKDGRYGLLVIPRLGGLPPGTHGLHVHRNADCGPGERGGAAVPGLAAGGHFDPAGSKAHKGPYGPGHLGDLPAIYVDDDGKARLPVLAPRLKLEQVRGRSLMLHAGGDNYADDPLPLGGGGPRLACGVISD